MQEDVPAHSCDHERSLTVCICVVGLDVLHDSQFLMVPTLALSPPDNPRS